MALFWVSDGKKSRNACSSLNVNEEYLCALRTKSYVDFFTKAQFLVNEPLSPSIAPHRFSEILLEPDQETITTILGSPILSKNLDLKALLFEYFDISAEASKICTHLLKSIHQIQSHQKFIQKMLDMMDGNSNDKTGSMISELHSSVILNDPSFDSNEQDFGLIRDKYSSLLHHLKSKRKNVARKIKLINMFNKASGVCVTAACGLVAMAAIVVSVHTLTALVMGPAILSLTLKPLKKRILGVWILRNGFLRKVGKQLDAAAKGTYILNRDFDIMSRLVARLHDEIEHNKMMIRLCLERREDRFSLQVLRELKRSYVGFRKQVEQLEEHVYFCLVTINRARARARDFKDISTSCVEALVR